MRWAKMGGKCGIDAENEGEIWKVCRKYTVVLKKGKKDSIKSTQEKNRYFFGTKKRKIYLKTSAFIFGEKIIYFSFLCTEK